MRSGSVKVKVFGAEYVLRADLCHEDIIEAASMVDKRMQEIAAKSPDQPEVRVAVLAALNLASEILELKRQLSPTVAEKARELAQLLDAACKD